MAREAIFIGYRREDTADVAGRVCDALSARFGRGRIFKDVDNLRPGADFGDHIRALLPRCRVALVLIGPNWLNAVDEQGYRRLDDPHDWVRIEIELALDTPGLDVVPVLVNGARMPRADELPRSLHPLLRRHAAIIRRDPDFHDDVGRLTTALRASVKSGVLDLKSLGGERKAAAAGAGAGAPPIAAWLAGVAALALVGLLVWSPWQSGPPASSPADSAITETVDAEIGPPASSRQPEGRQDAGASGEAQTAQQQQNPCDAADETWAGLSASTDQRRIERFVLDTPASCNARGVANARLAELRRPQASGNRDCAECPEMVAIPAGSFTMGKPAGEEAYPGYAGYEEPQHPVSIRAFAVSKYEITFAQWDACVAGGGCGGYRPEDQGWGRGNRPVINVSWNDAQSYITWLNGRAGGGRYRLLSEAEWEYAARAGTSTAYSTGPTISASQARFSSQSTAEVGSYPANRFGLHDMHGNVWEWTQDCWNANYNNAPANGSANTTGDCSIRVNRGGGWNPYPQYLRSASRVRYTPSYRGSGLGFRVARSASGG